MGSQRRCGFTTVLILESVMDQGPLVSHVWVLLLESLLYSFISGKVDVHLSTLVLQMGSRVKIMDNDILMIVNRVPVLLELMLVLLSAEVARSEAGITVALVQAAANVLSSVHFLLDFVVLCALHRLKGVASAEEALNLRVVVVVMDRMDLLGMLVLEPRVVEFVWETSSDLARSATRLGHNLA